MEELLELRRPPRRPGERLELAVTSRASEPVTGSRRAALLYGPHPLLGGDLENNVQRALAEACAHGGLAAVRFNYRGVGASEAHAGAPRYELWAEAERRGDFGLALEDGDEALRRTQRLARPALLVGYSFGAWVALHCALRAGLDLPLVLVAPPLGRMDFAGLADHPAATSLVLAGRDAFDPPPPAEELRERFPASRVVVRPEDDHFFRGVERELAREALGGVLEVPSEERPEDRSGRVS